MGSVKAIVLSEIHMKLIGYQAMENENGITRYAGLNLAIMLSAKILHVHKDFPEDKYIRAVEEKYESLTFSQRIELHADELKKYLPDEYDRAIDILIQILGEENPYETGMFKEYYWIMPVAKLVEKYGLDDFEESIHAIEEITKRNTGEYAIRPFIRKYPEKTIEVMTQWALSDNFHLRRLASEGLRPKLPWSQKLDTFIENPDPVFKILDLLKEDPVKFVKKSVANNIRDYIKVNNDAAVKLLNKWRKSDNVDTKWIIKHATRKMIMLK